MIGLRLYPDTVVHLGDTWRAPCSLLGLKALRPGPHGAPQDDFAAVRLDSDAARINLGTAPERCLDPALGIHGCTLRPPLNVVADALSPAHAPDGLFGPLPLIVPLDLAFERHPAILDEDLG